MGDHRVVSEIEPNGDHSRHLKSSRVTHPRLIVEKNRSNSLACLIGNKHYQRFLWTRCCNPYSNGAPPMLRFTVIYEGFEIAVLGCLCREGCQRNEKFFSRRPLDLPVRVKMERIERSCQSRKDVPEPVLVFAGWFKGSAACFEQFVVVLGSTDRATIGRFA